MDTTFTQTYFNLRRAARTLIIELINSANPGSNYVENDFLWGIPQTSLRENIACNTELKLTGNPLNQRTGVESIWYNRMHLNLIFGGSDVDVIPPSDAVYLSDVIEEINDKFGIYLTADDYDDVVLPVVTSNMEPRTVLLSAKPGSLMFTGSSEIKLGHWGLDVSEVAASSTDVYFVNYDEALTGGIWIRRVNAAMALDSAWLAVRPEYKTLPSTIKDHVVTDSAVNGVMQVFIGDMNYQYTSPGGSTINATTDAVAVVNGSIYNLNEIINSKTSLASLGAKQIYACTRGHHEGEVILGAYCASTGLHYNIVVTLNIAFDVVGVVSCAAAVGGVNNAATRYIDLLPVHYLDAPAVNAPCYVNVLITASSAFLRFYNSDLTLSTTFAPVAIDSTEMAAGTFFSLIEPSHFSFSGHHDGVETKVLLNMKPGILLYDKDITESRFTCPVMRFNGLPVVPDAIKMNGSDYRKAWLGCVEFAAAGPMVATKFHSDVIPYSAMLLTELQAPESGACLMHALLNDSGYSGLRMGINPVYCPPAESVYPVNFSNGGDTSLRGMNHFAGDSIMTHVMDAVAEEVFYTDTQGVRHSRGMIWHVIGFAANSRNDFLGDKPKALTYMVFDANRKSALCRSSALATISMGHFETDGTYKYEQHRTFAWLVRH